MSLRRNRESKRYSADIVHRTFGRVHLHLLTKVKDVAMARHTALKQLLDMGEPGRDLVDALRAQKISIVSVEACARAKRPFDSLRASAWPTIAGAVAQYLETLDARENIADNTWRNSRSGLQHFEQFFGSDTLIESLTHEDMARFNQHLFAGEFAVNTVVTYMMKVGALYTYLQKRETKRSLQQKRAPAVLFSPLDRDEHVPDPIKTRVRFLDQAEAYAMIENTPPRLQFAIALGIFAGLRINEILHLRHGMDLDLERSVIYVQARDGWHPKYKLNREVPVSSALEHYAEQHFAQHLVDKNPYVFHGLAAAPMNEQRMQEAIIRIANEAGLEGGRKTPAGITMHTLRHTFASWLVMAGADLFTIARLMGHTSTKQVEATYAHLSPQHRLATVELLSTRWLATEPASSPTKHRQSHHKNAQ